MKQYNVKMTDKALNDMAAIYDYIVPIFQAHDTAIKQYDRIAEAIESLDKMSERFKLFDSQPKHDLGMR